jgi:four helix bundle protein
VTEEKFLRGFYKENLQFCRNSRGSLFEIIDDLITREIENYITKEQLEEAKAKVNKTLKLLNRFITNLDKVY